ncbi:Scn11a [Symbiodinium natans]|uniref:Scn11a protein n=1 Tax=Symbiodinium natans TaxID=878477 RepID=A0A812I613_9DINO|nr:Scn11a [Symbiodinium natans]
MVNNVMTPVDKGKKVFTLNAEDMRRRLRECFKRECIQSEENVPTSICGRIARSNFFNTCVLVIIILNSLWIAVDTDFNKSGSVWDAPYPFLITENLFCLFFTVELVVRMGAFQNAAQFCDGWFLFDSSLTVMMIWDTWVSFLVKTISGHNVISSQVRSFTVLRVLRVLRIARVARAARIINSLPELRVLVKGMVIAMRSTCTILALLLIIVYIFAILFVQLLSESQVGKGWFENVPQAMNFLLLQTLAGADVNVINKLLAAGWTYYILYLTFVFMGSLTLMNMLIGVLCEVVGVVAQIEEERAFHDEAQSYIANFVDVLDMDGDHKLSKVEFLQLMERDPDLLRGLQAFGIDVVAFCDNAIALFSDTDNMEVGDFVELVTQFRSQKQTTVKDLVDMRKFISMQLRHLAEEVRGRYGHARIEAALDLTHSRDITAVRYQTG